jgi:hypothetical protein
MQAGCSSSVLQLRGQLDLHRGEFVQKFDDRKDLVTKFLDCTRQAHDEPLNKQRDSSASLNPLSLQSSEGHATSVRPLTSLINRVRWHHQGKDSSLYILADVLDDVANDANARIDVDKLKQVIEVARQWHGHLGLDEDQLEQDSSRFARLLLAYNKAYFGDISFTASSDYSGAGLHGIVKVTSKGFVDRSGTALLYPGVSAEFEPRPADSQRVSADLMRIFLEALFDAAYRVPAVHGATALGVAPSSQESAYPEFDANRPMISLEALARVTRDALRAEAAVTSLVGKAVRGGSVFSTQNETFAATLETAAGVIAKKLVEHEGFCYYQVIEGMPAAG